MIIVAGHIITKPGCRDQFVSLSRSAMVAARQTAGCHDFVVTADPLDAERVHIFEAWADAEKLAIFREDGPGSDLSKLIYRIEVRTYSAQPQ